MEMCYNGDNSWHVLDEEDVAYFDLVSEFCRNFYQENWCYPTEAMFIKVMGLNTDKINVYYGNWHGMLECVFNEIIGGRCVGRSFELRKYKDSEDYQYIGIGADLCAELGIIKDNIIANRKLGDYYVKQHVNTYKGKVI